MKEIEKKIQEQRSVEATTKKLMGFKGKLGIIVRNLGQPLIDQSTGGPNISVRTLEDFYAPYDDSSPYELKSGMAKDIQDQIPIMNIPNPITGEPMEEPSGTEWQERNRNHEDCNIETIGWHFDGLSRGIHLEISYLEGKKELITYYKGSEVYREVGGELEAYIPDKEWEYYVERLYAVAKGLDKSRQQQERTEEIIEAQKEKTKWWTEIKRKWGL